MARSKSAVPVQCFYLTTRAHHRLIAVAPAGARIDLKALAAALGLPRLSLGGARVLRDELGTTPGALTPLAVRAAGDTGIVTLIDRTLMSAPCLALAGNGTGAILMTPRRLITRLVAGGFKVRLVSFAPRMTQQAPSANMIGKTNTERNAHASPRQGQPGAEPLRDRGGRSHGLHPV